MSRETNVRKSVDEQAAPLRSVSGKGPMSSSRSHDGHSLRKPPSLSTLALPNFSGMRPPSQDLLNAFASLLARLPQENRDLLHTVIDLINFVAQRKAIRMPLSNLTVVLCPTLNMSPPILRVLCGAESIWKGLAEGQEDIAGLDPERDYPNPVPDGQTGLESEQNFAAEPHVPQDDPSDQSSAAEPVSGVQDLRVERHAPSVAQDDIHRDGPALDDRASCHSVYDSRPPTPAWGKGSPLDPWFPPALTSSSDSLTTPSTSSEDPSIPQMIAPTLINAYYAKENVIPTIIPDFVRTSPQPADHIPVLFPGTETAPRTHSSHRHLASVPSFTQFPSEPSSQSMKPTRVKRPSLTALFSKKSVSSLRSSRLFSSSSSSSPYFDARDSPSRSSPTSLRTPISPLVISAPSLMPRRSSSSLPPILNTSIDSSSLSLAIGLDAEGSGEAGYSRSELRAVASREFSSSPQLTDPFPLSSPTSPVTPVALQSCETSNSPKLPLSQPEPLQPQLSEDSFLSVSSATYRRLSLLKENDAQDNWTRDLLNDLGWSPTAVEHSMTGKA
jgi:hypothetical protein